MHCWKWKSVWFFWKDGATLSTTDIHFSFCIWFSVMFACCWPVYHKVSWLFFSNFKSRASICERFYCVQYISSKKNKYTKRYSRWKYSRYINSLNIIYYPEQFTKICLDTNNFSEKMHTFGHDAVTKRKTVIDLN